MSSCLRSGTGNAAKPLRMSLGTLMLRTKFRQQGTYFSFISLFIIYGLKNLFSLFTYPIPNFKKIPDVLAKYLTFLPDALFSDKNLL